MGMGETTGYGAIGGVVGPVGVIARTGPKNDVSEMLYDRFLQLALSSLSLPRAQPRLVVERRVDVVQTRVTRLAHGGTSAAARDFAPPVHERDVFLQRVFSEEVFEEVFASAAIASRVSASEGGHYSPRYAYFSYAEYASAPSAFSCRHAKQLAQKKHGEHGACSSRRVTMDASNNAHMLHLRRKARAAKTRRGYADASSSSSTCASLTPRIVTTWSQSPRCRMQYGLPRTTCKLSKRVAAHEAPDS